MLEAGKTRGRKARTRLDEKMFVKSQTIGTSTSYAMLSQNISRTGLLLSWDNKHKVPFREKTLIQMTIDCGSALFSEPLHCLGKVVRIATVNERTTQYGIRIVQIGAKDQATWEDKINELEDLYLHQQPEMVPAAAQ